MSEANVRQIMAAVGQVASGFEYDEVIDASGQIILNALRQQHARHIDAEAQLESMFENMRASLLRDHYDERGKRKDRRIILPPLAALTNG